MSTNAHLSDMVVTTSVEAAAVAGTTDLTSDTVDTAGYDGCRFIALVGALSANQVTELKITQSDDDGSSDAYSDVAGTKAGPMVTATDGGKLLITDILRPQKRYLRAVFLRETGNAVLDRVIVELYRGRNLPVTQSSSIAALVKTVNPAEGTA